MRKLVISKECAKSLKQRSDLIENERRREMFCSNCGFKLLENSAFCSNCGTPVATANSNNANSGFNLDKTIDVGKKAFGLLKNIIDDDDDEGEENEEE